ncbi:MAG: 2TM domain-containing protein [Bacteroidetes bacterium]|nr:2TM domain-containing protein [Bacteroidota bacterium]
MSHNRIKATGRQKTIFFVHLLIYAIGVTAMFMIHAGQEKAAQGWVYPWHSWFVAAWSLAVIGHFCTLVSSYEDPGMEEYRRQTQNG